MQLVLMPVVAAAVSTVEIAAHNPPAVVVVQDILNPLQPYIKEKHTLTPQHKMVGHAVDTNLADTPLVAM